MKPIVVSLLGTLHPNKIRHVKDIKMMYDKYPCEVCKHLDTQRDWLGKYKGPCVFRKNRCWVMGKCKYFERAGETMREAEEWRKVNAWR